VVLISCSTAPATVAHSAPHSLYIVSILNTYLPPQSDENFTHLAVAVRDFDKAVEKADIKAGKLLSVGDGLVSNDEVVRSIAQHDAPDVCTIAYIASHGSPDGLVLKDSKSFDELYQMIESSTRGTIVVFLDSCYSGLFATALARHNSDRVFAITGTKGASLERWYSQTGSFSQALALTIRSRVCPSGDGMLTLGQLYDGIAQNIHSWNAANPHVAGPINDPDLYGPRDLVLFDYNK
jgi:hypothetical protein